MSRLVSTMLDDTVIAPDVPESSDRLDDPSLFVTTLAVTPVLAEVIAFAIAERVLAPLPV